MYCDKDTLGKYSISDITAFEMGIIHAALSSYVNSFDDLLYDDENEPVIVDAVAPIEKAASQIRVAVYRIMKPE